MVGRQVLGMVTIHERLAAKGRNVPTMMPRYGRWDIEQARVEFPGARLYNQLSC
jgi:hypothetical protein